MFYTYAQSNSGGYFFHNEDVDEYVIIEGDSLKEINEKATNIFSNYMLFCTCCGERWYSLNDEEDEDCTSQPEIFEELVYDYHDGYEKNAKAIIYYKDGRKEFVNVARR